MPGVMPRTRRRGTGGRFDKDGGRSDGRFSLHPENPIPESRMHATVPARFGRGRLDSLVPKGLAAYLIAGHLGLRAYADVSSSNWRSWVARGGGPDVVPTDARNISADFVSRLFAANES